ncbi:MAG: hypothetical protein PHS97_07160 [Oscillospiraceae bacterium]|nr:hypothetical protein [Oscillospiraceae bacterium]
MMLTWIAVVTMLSLAIISGVVVGTALVEKSKLTEKEFKRMVTLASAGVVVFVLLAVVSIYIF